MTQADLEDVGCRCPGVADGFKWGLPADGFEVLGEVVCRHESNDVGFEAFEVGIVKRLDGRFLDRPVHAFGLAVGPWVVWLGELVLDAVLVADAVEDVGAEIAPARPISIFWQICKGHSIIGQHGMDSIRKRLDDPAQKLGAVHLAGFLRRGPWMLVRSINRLIRVPFWQSACWPHRIDR